MENPIFAASNPVSLGARAAAAVAAALPTSAPPEIAGRIRLLAASLEGSRLKLNFSREVLELGLGSGAFEAFAHEIDEAASAVLETELRTFDLYFLIDGVPLERLFESKENVSVPSVARDAVLLPAPPVHSAQALSGRRVAISPGHGYYFTGSIWGLQRPFLQGIVEDFVNHDFVTILNNLLVADGADVRPTRNLDRNAGNGESGFPKWQEAARYHVKALGADPSVWNESGFTHLEQDIRCRPRYANAIEAELLVSIHNNGGGGTGTETLYDTGNAFAAQNKRLADVLHASVMNAIRRDYNPTWRDRLVKGFNGSYGENRLATRPAVILEIAFMDMPTPDNAALQDERFKRIVATAIRDGIAEYLGGSTAPAAPAALIASGETAAISLAWTDTTANETGFRIERKAGAAMTWTTLGTVAANVTTYRDTAVTAGVSYIYRVQSFNAAGPSVLFTNEVTTTTLAAPPALRLASVTPTTNQIRNWGEVAEFTLAVTDAGGRPVSGATLVVNDGLRNSLIEETSVTADATGIVTFRASVPTGLSNGAYPITFQATLAGFTASPVVAAIGASPLSYQWRFNGVDIVGATGATVLVSSARPTDAGGYSVVVTNALGSVTSVAAEIAVDPAAWLSSVSLRTTLAAAQTLTVGFVVNGGSKDLLVRAAGPALASFGLSAFMADPRMELFREGVKVADNNDWPAAFAPVFSRLGAFPFPAASRDSALLRPVLGAHTVEVTGTTGGTVLAEVYDAGSGSAARLIGLAARNRVGTGDDVLIAGFYLSGTGTRRVLIRGIGPALGLPPFNLPGVLANPTIEVRDGSGRIAENDDWSPALAAVFSQVGAFPLTPGSRDAAVVVTLSAGISYTVQVSGVGGGVGEGIVEIYEVP
ncbi:MAG: N-acetylmuramoyl-L-alanine amidase [Verrucomicrobia bacterium]|nr:N-acetylmuramoyl-L-alanine amidase [Verrucomicrobiota bacterium]